MAYSGTTENAVSHFEGLGLKRPDEMNIPEFLLRCASSPADLWEGAENGTIPKALSSSTELASAFIASPAGQAVANELEDKGDERATESAFANDGNAPALKDFAQPTSRQIQLLIARGWKLVLRNPATLMRLVSAVVSISAHVYMSTNTFCGSFSQSSHAYSISISQIFGVFIGT